MADLISIIVPVYNASEYLKQCIESIVKQTYKALEIILVDDGSTDDSTQICEHYRRLDGRIQVIHKDNGGLVSARKAGLKIASGNYIGFVDADDYIANDMFESLYLKLKEYDADFAHSGMIIGNQKICNEVESVVDFTLNNKIEFINNNIFRNQKIIFALWSKLFKAELVKAAYMQLNEKQNYGEDLLCMCYCILMCNKFCILKDAFYHYRIYQGSLSHLGWLDTCIQESMLYTWVIELFKKNNLMDKCIDSVRYHYKARLMDALTCDMESGVSVLRYRIKDMEFLNHKKIVIYGAGNVGKDFYIQLCQNNQCEIVAWVDKEKHDIVNLIPIQNPDVLKNIYYDLIIIAVKSKTVADEIKKELVYNNICPQNSKIRWEEPICTW